MRIVFFDRGVMQQRMKQKNEIDLSVDLGHGLKMANPVMTASGTCGYAFELRDFVDLSRLGAFVTKSITAEPRIGNPPQRTVETSAGMLNAIGLANMGLEAFCEQTVPLLKRLACPVFANVAGRTFEDYLCVARGLRDQEVIAGLEINVSCPNVKQGGITFGTDPAVLGALVSQIRQACPEKFLIVKLTPNVTDITVTARAAADAGANALSLINTLTGMAVDLDRRRPVLANRTGGLSGPAIKPVALYMVDRVYREVARPAGIPLIAMGGIAGWRDALEFIIAGASAVALGTAALVNPRCLTATIDGIAAYLQEHKIPALRDLIGVLAAPN